MAELKKRWKKLTEGWKGTLIYLVLGVFLAYSFHFVLGVGLSTDLPVVTISSQSLEHGWFKNLKTEEISTVNILFKDVPYKLCGHTRKNWAFTNFDDYWRLCGGWYEKRGISKKKFKKFQFHEGLNVGDIVFVVRQKDYNIGDIIVFDGWESTPIIHRIVDKYTENGIVKYATKGDHNSISDPSEYNPSKEEIHGKAVLLVPLLGWVKIITFEIFSYLLKFYWAFLIVGIIAGVIYSSKNR